MRRIDHFLYFNSGTTVVEPLFPGRSSQPRDAPPAHVARAALLAPHGGRDGPDHGELGGGAGLLAAG